MSSEIICETSPLIQLGGNLAAIPATSSYQKAADHLIVRAIP